MPGLKKCCRDIPQRWLVAVLCCSVMAVALYQRKSVRETINLFVVVSYADEKRVITQDGCPYLFEPDKRKEMFSPNDIYWTRNMVKGIHHSFSLGYIIFQIPAGIACEWFGAQLLLGLGIMISSLLCFILPHLGKLGAMWFMSVHFLQGISQSVLFPCCFEMVARWAPITERTSFVGTIISGLYIGYVGCYLTILALFLWLPRWDISLYLAGVVGVLWCLMWFGFGCKYLTRPIQNLRPQNLEIIISSRRHTRLEISYVPWRKMLSSRCFLSLIIIFCAMDWTHSVILNQALDPYITNVLHLPLFLRTFLPLVEITAVFPMIGGSVFCDWLTNNHVISRSTNRKLFASFGLISTNVLMLLGLATGCNLYVFGAVLVIMLFFKSFSEFPIYSHVVDISPAHAGLLVSIANTFGSVTVMFSREFVHRFITEPDDVSQWRNLSFVTLILVLLCSVQFIVFGTSDQQQWETPDPSEILDRERRRGRKSPQQDS